MIQQTCQRLALILFWAYLAVFPGSTIVVALDRVPIGAEWMGGALLLIQGAAALCWLLGRYGWRGALTALLVVLSAWGVEHLGVISGFPFGRYFYTDALQPRLLGVVPLAIASAWLMVAVGAWQLTTNDQRRMTNDERSNARLVIGRWSLVKAASLILLLDLQIETIATRINRYWVWIDGGLYYGVPIANFVAWWLVGLGMVFMIDRVLPRNHIVYCVLRRGAASQYATRNTQYAPCFAFYISRFTHHISYVLPASLYLLSTLMFTVVNLARGYTAAGLVGVSVLLTVSVALPRVLGQIASPKQGD
jgi:uncharacterized membrane protein